MKLFNAVIIILFVMLGLAALAVIATFSGRGGEGIGNVAVWGPLPENVVGKHINDIAITRTDFSEVRYTPINPHTFVDELAAAIAANRGPDLVVFPAEYLYVHADKLVTIPFSSLSRRAFQDTYIEAGEILIEADGIKGLPYMVDPLVLYWNRTLFSAASIARPPRYWDEVSDAVASIATANQAGSLTRSGIALGEWDNVSHAKEILLSLFKQLGNDVVSRDGGESTVVLSKQESGTVSSAESVLRYYTEFSDPNKPVYSWNRSQASSFDAFIGGKLGMYIGFASELSSLRSANPNLNFDVAALPAARGSGSDVAARMYVIAAPRGAKNLNGALSAAFILSGAEAQGLLRELTSLPSVRRDLAVISPDNPYAGIFRDAALNAFVFPDPNPRASDAIFKRAVENISSGRLHIAESITAAAGELRVLLQSR